MRTWAGLSLAVLVAAPFQAPLFRTRTDVVAVSVTVADDNGRVVRGLSADAFSVAEDGRTRPIEYFVGERLPLSLVLALDTSESMKGGRYQFAREAVSIFVDALSPDDEVALIGFSDSPYTLTNWTRSRDAIAEALNAVTPKGRTALYDAVLTSLATLGGAANRRSAIVVISDGHDYRWTDRRSAQVGGLTPEDLQALREQRVLAAERRSEALVYAVGVDAPDGSNDPDKYFDPVALRRLTDPTGGYTRVVTRASAIPRAAQEIREELNQQYVLGFTPEHPGDGKFHRISVAVSGCRCRARARAGFLADRVK